MGNTTNGGCRHSRLAFFLARYFLLSLLSGTILPANATCWYRRLVEAIDSAKCYDSYDPTSDNMCCKVGDACLVNRMCAHKNGDHGDWAYYRGSCTDPDWVTNRCPVDFCYSGGDFFVPPDDIETMAPCPDKNDYWYCNASRNLDSCQHQSGAWEIPGKQLQARP